MFWIFTEDVFPPWHESSLSKFAILVNLSVEALGKMWKVKALHIVPEKWI